MKYKESETIEFKKTTSELKEAVISISAILLLRCLKEKMLMK